MILKKVQTAGPFLLAQPLLTELHLNLGAMLDLTLNDNDKEWLQAHYPSLKVHVKDKKLFEIIGSLRFSMAFSGEGKPYVIDPPPNNNEGVKIEDEYKVRIELRGSEFSNLPQVYESDDRLEKIVRDRNLKLEDLHINPSGAACLCIQQEETDNLPSGFNLKDFFNNLVIPFFYAQSYFEKNNTWPWGQYSHGVWGLVEWYLKQKNPTKQATEDFLDRLKRYSREWQLLVKWLAPKYRVKGHHQCACGSSEKFRNCHKDVLHGVWKLKETIGKFGVKVE